FLNQDIHSKIIDDLFEEKKYSELKIDTNFAKEYFAKIEKHQLNKEYESINDDVIENLLEYSLSPNGFVKTNYDDNEMKEYYAKIHFLNLDNNNHLSSKNIEKWISINPENKFHYTLILNSVLETYKIALNSEIKSIARQKIKNEKKENINKINEFNKILEVLEEVKNIDKLLEIKSELNKDETEENKLFNKYKLKKLATIDILSNDLFDKILDNLRIENNSFENHKSIRKKYIQHRMFLILLLIFVSLFGASGIVFSAYEIIKEFNVSLLNKIWVVLSIVVLIILFIFFIWLAIFIGINKTNMNLKFTDKIEYKKHYIPTKSVEKVLDILDEIALLIKSTKNENNDVLVSIRMVDFSEKDINVYFLSKISDFIKSVFHAKAINTAITKNKENYENIYFEIIFDKEAFDYLETKKHKFITNSKNVTFSYEKNNEVKSKE
ncbi:hypothetical protein C4M81_03660, partial [Mycoplasmopsis pullorum]